MTRARKRAQFGARNVEEAKATARRLVAVLIGNYLGEGQPEVYAKELGIPEADARRLRVQLRKLQRQFIC